MRLWWTQYAIARAPGLAAHLRDLEARAAKSEDPEESARLVASTSPGGPHIADLAGGRGWLDFAFARRHADPQISVTVALWA